MLYGLGINKMEGIRKMTKFVVYSGNDEVLVTTKKLEKKMLKEWFDEDGRNLDLYDRTIVKETAVNICCDLIINN